MEAGQGGNVPLYSPSPQISILGICPTCPPETSWGGGLLGSPSLSAAPSHLLVAAKTQVGSSTP